MTDHHAPDHTPCYLCGGAPASPAPIRTVPAGGLREYITITVRDEDAARVDALLPFITYGPDYLRGVLGALRDYSLFVSRCDFAAAEIYLSNAENMAAAKR